MSTDYGVPGTQLEFAWDPDKEASNLAKHGVTFAAACAVLTDSLAITVFDAAHSAAEERWFTLGTSAEGKLLAVAHTYTASGLAGARVRIISAREATRAERRQYEEGPR